jgi:hypothetical protein
MSSTVSLPWDTGYALFFLAGLFGIWIGVPVINSVFGLSLMTVELNIPVVGTHPMNVLFGATLALIGLLGYIGNRFDLW